MVKRIEIAINFSCVLMLLFIMSNQAISIDFENVKSISAADKNLVPVLIIGSGVAGLSAALYTARAKLPTVVLAGNEPGGQLMGSSLVENMPGVVATAGYKVIDHIERQARDAGVAIVYDSVQIIERVKEGYFKVSTEQNGYIYALTIIIATGASSNLLHVPGEQALLNNGVYTCAVCDCRQATGKNVVVVGGGDSAIETVMHLAPYAKTVTMLVRGERMRASVALQEKLKNYSHVKILFQHVVTEMIGKTVLKDEKDSAENELQSLMVDNLASKEIYQMTVDCAFLAIGHTPVEGIFAAGDATDPRYKQAAKASGDAVAAALEAIAFLHERGFSVEQASLLSDYYFKTQEEST
jgi:thioredoxin reductase (NADPH)